MVFKKIIFQNSLMANETPSRPPPLMANAIKNFHFDYLNTSLTQTVFLHIKNEMGNLQLELEKDLIHVLESLKELFKGPSKKC